MKDFTKYTGPPILSDIKYDLRHNKSLIAMLTVPVLLCIVFNCIPLPGLIIAFQDYRPLTGFRDSPWVGFTHFLNFFRYYDFPKIMKNTILLNGYSLLVMPIPMIFALALHHCPFPRLKRLLDQVSLMPIYISTVVICGMLQRFLASEGILNQVLAVFGMEPVNHLLNGPLFYSIYVLSGLWQNCGSTAVFYTAILADSSVSQHEAAQIDGANLLQRIIYLDLPLLKKYYWIQFLFNASAILSNNVEKVLLLQNTANQAYSSVISTYTYELAFESIMPQYSMATAIGLLTSVIQLTIYLCFDRKVRRMEEYK